MAPTAQFLVGLLAAFAPTTLASCAYGTHLHPRAEEITAPTFSYWGPTGPAAWHAISAANGVCANGTNQSPINVAADTTTVIASSELSFTLGNWASGATFENLGSTVEVVAPAGNLTVNGVDYTLSQYHFHLPSEHLDNGTSMAMEMHLVWQSAAGQIAVTGVFIDIADGKSTSAKACDVRKSKSKQSRAPKGKSTNEKRIIDVDVDINLEDLELTVDLSATSAASSLVESVLSTVDQIPNLGDHITTAALDMSSISDLFAAGSFSSYAGSLTTPPCTEGVSWFVSTQKVSVTASTFFKVRDVIGYNSRFPQNSPGAANVLSL